MFVAQQQTPNLLRLLTLEYRSQSRDAVLGLNGWKGVTPRGHVCCRQPLGTPGVAPFPIDPSGKGFSRLDLDRHPGSRRSRPARRHSIAGSAPGKQEWTLIFTVGPCYIFSSRRPITRARRTQREVGKEIAKANAIGLALARSSRKVSARRLWLASLKPPARTSRSLLTTRNGLSPAPPQASEKSS